MYFSSDKTKYPSKQKRTKFLFAWSWQYKLTTSVFTIINVGPKLCLLQFITINTNILTNKLQSNNFYNIHHTHFIAAFLHINPKTYIVWYI